MYASEADVLFRWPLPEEWLPHLSGFRRDCAIFRIGEYRIQLIWLERYKVFSVGVYRKHPKTKRWRRSHWKHCEPADLACLYQIWSRHDP